MEAIDKQALRILKLFGNEGEESCSRPLAEQEYFLIDTGCIKRPDLIYCGRTLFMQNRLKARKWKIIISERLNRVSAFMKELEEELWKLGVLAKTKHNEVPAQHELAPIYTTVNIATDHNQLTMELLKTVANKHNFTCLLHENLLKA